MSNSVSCTTTVQSTLLDLVFVHFFTSELLISVDVTFDSSSITTDSLTISWTVTELPEDVIVTEYTISYSNTDCPNDIYYDEITGISDSETMYTLDDLEEGTEYSITVTAVLSDDGKTASDTVTATTIAVG